MRRSIDDYRRALCSAIQARISVSSTDSGKRAAAEELVVEGAHVEPVAQRLLGLGAQRLDPELADLVRQRLARPGDVAVDLVVDVEIALAGVLLEVVDRLVARPLERVHAGVDHQAHRAPHVVVQLADLREVVLVQAEVVAELLAVQRPAFDEGRVVGIAAELRQAGEFVRQRDLQVMTRAPTRARSAPRLPRSAASPACRDSRSSCPGRLPSSDGGW